MYSLPDCEKFQLEAGELKSGQTLEAMTECMQGYEHNQPPDQIMSRFVLLLECKVCHEKVAMAGLMDSVWETHDETDPPLHVQSDTLIPRMIDPPPKLFSIPKQTPQDVKDIIIQSFRLLLTALH